MFDERFGIKLNCFLVNNVNIILLLSKINVAIQNNQKPELRRAVNKRNQCVIKLLFEKMENCVGLFYDLQKINIRFCLLINIYFYNLSVLLSNVL